MMPQAEALYEQHAQNCEETDFWGQVRRTVNGKPVSEEHITLIVDQTLKLLELNQSDRLLDICCGNGALSSRFFERCSGGLGIDYSETLISVANRHFDGGESVNYVAGEAIKTIAETANPEQFTKGVVYGSINYFSRENAEILLTEVRQRFPNISNFVIGNVADLAHIKSFFDPGQYEPGLEDRPDSAIGVWWSKDGFSEMAARSGWSVTYHQMPEPFYARHYRFDAVLRPV